MWKLRLKVVNEQIKRKHETDLPRLKRKAPLQEFMKAFCQRRKKGSKYYIFKYKGQELMPSDTPYSLNMQRGDVIKTTLWDQNH